MMISARNNLMGKVEKVEKGMVTATVKMKIEVPAEITAVITKDSVEEMNIKAGDVVTAIIKSTEVMVGKE